MKSILLLVIIGVFYSVAALTISKGRIAEGQVAKEKDYPYVVSITDNDRHFCGGWIYSPSWIVTTASCISGKEIPFMKVVVGQVSNDVIEPAEQTIPVFNSYVFYGYNSTSKENDIALLKLSADIRFDDNNDANDVLHFPLAVNNVKYTEADSNLPGKVLGWGATVYGGSESTNLRYGNVTIVPNGQPCSDYDNAFFRATMVCAYGTPNIAGSPCQYDEGGPLVQEINGEHFVVGIVSTVKNCNSESYALYTRVSAYYAWLQRSAGDQPLPLQPAALV